MSTVATTDRSPSTVYLQRFRDVRKRSNQIAAPLSPEDCVVQSMPDASPVRWHLAHTTWFFETFLLKPRGNHSPFNPEFEYLFNSYYNTVGKQFDRSRRGMLSRPGLHEVLRYREQVDDAVATMLQSSDLSTDERAILETGLNHEQQHQELMLTDVKHMLSCNPLHPEYLPASERVQSGNPTHDWLSFDEGLFQMGHAGEDFAFDNETPRHRVFLEDYSIASRCVTNGQFIEFIESGGYQEPKHWLSMGWSWVQANQVNSPSYWVHRNDQWFAFTLHGLQPIDLDAPVCHVSYFEADAYARWAGYRLPTESEWEHARQQVTGDSDATQPSDREGSLIVHPSASTSLVDDWDRQVWQWTASQYTAYPGYRPADGALGEYNGKFMCNQFVLRGGSCVTSPGHTRPTYRNFFPPEARWQFTGFRLAK